MLALALYEAQVCECGFHRSLTHDENTLYTLEQDSCPICADVAALKRTEATEDEKAEKALGDKAPPEKPRPSDGRHSAIRLLSQAEAEAMQAEAERAHKPRRKSRPRTGPQAREEAAQ